MATTDRMVVHLNDVNPPRFGELLDLLGDQVVWVAESPSAYMGETRVYNTTTSGSGGNCFHADPDCPHFPEAPVEVRPISSVRGSSRLRPCGYCTTEAGE